MPLLPHAWPVAVALVTSWTLAAALPPPRASGFLDPAPPKPAQLVDITPPKALPHPELKFHAAPRPLAARAVTHDWRAFLGPAHNAISTETPLLKKFGPRGPGLVWEVARGESYATPAVIGERVIHFHRVGAQEVVECLQAETGRRFWRFAYPTAYSDRYGFGNGPRCQPVSDGTHVYTLGAAGRLHCLKLTTGQMVWQRDLLREFKLEQNYFGVGSTPLLESDRLIVNLGVRKGPGVAAFDARTGRMLWGAGDTWAAGYASPIPATVLGKRRVFVFAGGDDGEGEPRSGGLLCLDPANGRVDFRFPWRSRRYESANVSSPVVIGNQVFLSECYGPGGAVLALSRAGGGEALALRKVWSNDNLNTHFMTAIHKAGHLYGVAGHGPQNAPLVCVELNTGKEKWRHEPDWEVALRTSEGERKVTLSPGLASLLLVDGRCLMLSDTGQLAWLDLNPRGYRELDRTTLFAAQETWSMPALSRGLLYVCQNNRGIDGSRPRLLCYDLRRDE